MDAIRKQASKLRDQVARQQQAVAKQFTGLFGNDLTLLNEDEQQCYNKLQMLYASTKAAKHLQRDIARGIEAFIAVSYKQMDIVKKLAEDCCNYGTEYQSSDFALARASVEFSSSHNVMENEQDILLRNLGHQVYEPLRSMVMSASLEDARLLTYHYERVRQDVEAQAAEVIRRQLKSLEVNAVPEAITKLQYSESKLSELRKSLSAIGAEANAAMIAVEEQQQETTFQCLLEMVDAERAYHQNVAITLHKLRNVMMKAKHHSDSMRQYEQSGSIQSDAVNDDKVSESFQSEDVTEDASMKSGYLSSNGHINEHFVAEVVHPFDAQSEEELSLAVGDYIVVRKVAPNGWSEGEAKGKAGWFPSAYVERRQKAPATKVLEPTLLAIQPSL